MKQIVAGRKSHRVWIVGGVTLSMIVFFSALAAIPAVSPVVGGDVADLLRNALGPQPVAQIESLSFRMQDAVNQAVAKRDGGKLQIALNQQAIAPLSTPPAQQAVIAAPVPANDASTKNAIPVLDNAVTASPQIGWQAYGPAMNGQPVMAQTLLTLDPVRSYAGIALVRIDLSKLQLHMMPGFLEPSNTAEVQKAFPNLGRMPASDQSRLIAAFNGGFKAVNGHYGMMVNGVTLLPPVIGMATIAVYRDGHVQIGGWEHEILPSPDIVAYRQNCPLILENGQLNPEVLVNNPKIWGETIGNQEITWRTGIGITQDGRYLIYAVGNATTVNLLAQALQQAGAYNAMQLDINHPFAHFVTYQSTGKAGAPLTAVELLSQMENDPTLYLVAHSRDYFYLTTP